MKIEDYLIQGKKLFLDTAPVIYYVENNPQYQSLVNYVFENLDSGLLSAVTSPITLSECLVYPYRLGLTELKEDFIDLIVSGVNVEFIQIDELIAKQASQLRAKYNLALLDSLQISVAIVAKCDVFLTNDIQLKRVTELPILVLSDFLAGGKNG
ncbi:MULTISPECIES: PIN domain-containing protein [Nostocales]|jgi:predicted nucleic acid-binding protein|uniref:PIN domain-containing protein n=2 Tax=Dolichospermum TaxID=748770 RepID=A0A1Z4UY31_9CYAN|nr:MULTISPECIES: PIN domain-containing protein [Nostocales]MCX5982511.1 PIN domain-containing protein [Nostocales cyanobacterium LacPavin_0920_SED1_MAG_38_18]ALB42552.1 twitching motility protein PilT [Anabaena sp. WA102]MBO1064482.1 type II toxin-antitoxin system VapC family toxin [Anabaena sp. 54]MTJ43331.1 type II toxin-antitoxin system VapC family toxin [Dolichospermum flos-aquae UHCC 0037]OBQ21685.1 MAG: twitching motility protein PilT [Anabaena sp. AL93]